MYWKKYSKFFYCSSKAGGLKIQRKYARESIANNLVNTGNKSFHFVHWPQCSSNDTDTYLAHVLHDVMLTEKYTMKSKIICI